MKRLLGTAFAASFLIVGISTGQARGETVALRPPVWVSALSVAGQDVVGLRWLAVPGATGYVVLRSETKSKEHREIARVTTTSHFDRGIEKDKTYYYILRAVSGNQVSADSEERKVEIPRSEARQAPPVLPKGHPKLGSHDMGEENPCKICHDTAAGTATLRGAPPARALSFAGREIPPRPAPAPKSAAPPPSFSRAPEPQASRAVERSAAAPSQGYAAPLMKKEAGGPAVSAIERHDGHFREDFDEVWVIRRAADSTAPTASLGDRPSSGELRALLGEGRVVPLPLEHTEVEAAVRGYVADVTVSQRYHNPYESKIEAVYVFPLPENGAVSDFLMVIGERRIRGIIREREEAERIYQEARRQGYVAALLTQERPNIFTQKVANIEPGKRIDVEITYFNTLAYAEGEYTFVFPMVVGPRYNPAGTSEGIGAVGRGAGGISGQRTEVEYLRPGERSGHDIAVTVRIEAGVSLEKIYSNSHAIKVERKGKTGAQVRLAAADTVPNKDFVLCYRVAGREVRSALMVERDERGGYFTLMLQPPGNLEDLPVTGQELVFVLDTSGSMNGWPIAKAKAALRHALRKLTATDSFQIVCFANGFAQFAPAPVAGTGENVAAGLAWLEGFRGGGGTEMLAGIRAALDFPHDEQRLRIVSFMTDGYVGNEDQILRAVAEKLGPARIFSFGIGTSVNRHLIEGLGRIGRGAVAYVLPGDAETEAVDLFYDRIRHPALTDIAIDWGAMEVADVYPETVPDLMVGRPVIVTGRFRGHGEAAVRVQGRTGGERQEFTLTADLDEAESRHRGISRIWARTRIAGLMDRIATGGPGDLAAEVKRTALAYNLVSPYTAFVAVDSAQRTTGSSGTTVNVPVPVPEGVRYETTVQE